AHSLDDKEVAGHATATYRVGAVLHRHVVVNVDGLDLDALGLQHLCRRLERHPVAAVVVDDVEDALGRVEELGGFDDVAHRRGGEHVTGAGSVEHALAHDHNVG